MGHPQFAGGEEERFAYANAHISGSRCGAPGAVYVSLGRSSAVAQRHEIGIHSWRLCLSFIVSMGSF
jgi:hypothetical protein